VHNIAYQGRFWPETMNDLEMADAALPDFKFNDGYSKVYDERTPQAEEGDSKADIKGKHDKVNWMRAGFLTSDKNLTVSPNYATEVSSSPQKGVELNDILLQTGIEGIVNGACPRFARAEASQQISLADC
jgi:granule-bound starch synthase